MSTNLKFTPDFILLLNKAEELRKDEGLSHISEMEMLIAEYMMPNSIIAIYEKGRGIPEGIAEETLLDLRDSFDLDDNEIEEGKVFNVFHFENGQQKNTEYNISKTVKNSISKAGKTAYAAGKGEVVDREGFFKAIIQTGPYATKFMMTINKYATVSLEDLKERNAQKSFNFKRLENAMEELKKAQSQLEESQKALDRLKKINENNQNNKQNQQVPNEPLTENQVIGNTNTSNEETKFKPKKDEKAIPKKIEHCLTLLNDQICKGDECDILGRDDETKEVEKILLKTTKRNAVLVGDPGVGKTAIIEKIVWDIVNEKCPEQLKNQRVISLNVNGMISGTTLRGEAEERFKILTDFLEKNNDVVLFIDEMHTILGAGSAGRENTDLANALKPILARGQTRVIGATTSYEYEKYFQRDPALKRRFERVEVKEPKTFEVYDMIKNKVRKLEDSHEVLISKELVDFCIYTATCYKYDVKNPDRTLDLIDTSMAIANLRGTKLVTREIILSNFKKSMKVLKETPQEIKKATASHETGHYIVGRYSKSLESQKTIAVTIIPYENKFMGANLYEPADSFNTFLNKDYFIQQVGSLLAGRIAEEMSSGYITVGASSDVERATRLAKDYVTKYAMSDNISTMRSYEKKDEKDTVYLTEEKVKKIDEEIDKLLEESYKYAREILNEHKKELEKITQELLEKSILSDAEISAIIAEN